jgi:hypothetical protein
MPRGRPKTPLVLSDKQREQLQSIARSRSIPGRGAQCRPMYGAAACICLNRARKPPPSLSPASTRRPLRFTTPVRR